MFQSGQVCHFCMAAFKSLSELTTEHLCVLHSAEAHKQHLQDIAVNPKANKKLYGLNERSAMLELP